jgi:hypothetical protein
MAPRLDITRRLHERLLEIVRTALPLIPGSWRDADFDALAHLREEMVAAIDLYCRHVHRLRDDAIRNGGALAVERAEMLVAGCTSLRGAYDSFRCRWAQRAAVEHWHEYRLSAIVMMKQVRNRVQQAEAARTADWPLAA